MISAMIAKSRALKCATHPMTYDCRDYRFQKMERALRAILIEATRVGRGDFISLVDDLEKIGVLACEGLKSNKEDKKLNPAWAHLQRIGVTDEDIK